LIIHHKATNFKTGDIVKVQYPGSDFCMLALLLEKERYMITARENNTTIWKTYILDHNYPHKSQKILKDSIATVEEQNMEIYNNEEIHRYITKRTNSNN